MAENSQEYLLLPHHEQRDLCTTRLPYRQGRKLTAVKVYSINNESRHLLVFGVPSLNLRQETKALFSKFGKLLRFNLTKYPSEQFTETYHAVYEDIQSARIAKKMLDTKNFYGGNLHICYAPELETVDETKEKLLHRQKNVIARLKNLQKEQSVIPKKTLDSNIEDEKVSINKNFDEQKLFMGNVNSIQLEQRKGGKTKSLKRLKSNKSVIKSGSNADNKTHKHTDSNNIVLSKTDSTFTTNISKATSSCDIIDFTSANSEILTNINESLNYNNFGKELIKPVPYKPVNKIKFNINKNT